MLCPTVSTKARAVRELVRKQSLVRDTIGDSQDLCGACGYASWALWKVLPGSTLVLGEWDSLSHCWVELQGHIVDITATQFRVRQHVRVLSLTGPSAQKYDAEQRNKHAEQEIRDWYHNNWRRELLSLLRRDGLVP